MSCCCATVVGVPYFKHRYTRVLLAAILCLTTASAMASDLYWSVLNGDWSDKAPSPWYPYSPNTSDNAYIINGGTASVTKSVVCGALYLGDSGTEHSGTLQVSGGTLTTTSAYIGYSGIGVVSQSLGSVLINSGTLYLGYNDGSDGTYNLSGTGQLRALTEYIGFNNNADALFRQSGGTNTASFLSIGSNGRYSITGGALQINSGLANQGILDFGGSAAAMNVSNSIINFAAGGSVVDSNSATLNIGANSLLIVPDGFDPNEEFSHYSNAGILHTAGTLLTVPSGQTIAGCGNITDAVDCQGTISAGTGGRLAFYGPVVVSGGGSISGTVDLQSDETGSGISGGVISVTNHYVGYAGTGTFSNSGTASRDSATTLYLGFNVGASGTYNLTSTGRTTATTQYVGYSGEGTFTVSAAGTNACSYSYVGYNDSSNGVYNLNGAGTASFSSGFYVGYSGVGTVNQTDGACQSSNYGKLYLGYSAQGEGYYNLRGGKLTVTYQYGSVAEYVGYSGTGTFTHSGGTNTTQALYLGYKPGSSGTYRLSGMGQLVATSEIIGFDPAASATFQQNGGTNTASYVSISQNSHYLFSGDGGSLQINGGLENYGVLDLGAAPVAINASNAIINFARGGSLSNSLGGTLTVGANSLLIVPFGFDPASMFARYSNAGILHTAGTPLVIASEQTVSGWGNIDDHVDCAGRISASSGGFVHLNRGLTVSGTATVALGYGDLRIEDTTSEISGGSITCRNHYIGGTGTGMFTQSAGTISLINNSNGGGNLFVGHDSCANGTYVLSGTGYLYSTSAGGGNTYVGYSGTGTIRQSGGTLSLGSSVTPLYVGYNPGASGTYELSGTGRLIAPYQYVGYSGTATFTQTGGTNSGAQKVFLGYNSDGNGVYNLSDSGSFTSYGLYVGYSGIGHFSQTGGVASVGSLGIYLGYEAGSSGTYTLSGTATLNSSYYEYVGLSGTGTFDQTGGVHNLGSWTLSLGCNAGSSGTYKLAGSGQLIINPNQREIVGDYGTGTFDHSSGSNSMEYGSLYLAYNPGGRGTYNLSGTGQLTVFSEYVGYNVAATALFQQSGGTNSTTYLSIGPGGQYRLAGGVLNINGGFDNQGTIDAQGGSATLNIGDNSIVNLVRPGGLLISPSSLSVSLGSNSLLIVPSSFDPATVFSRFSKTATSYVHQAGTPFVIESGQTISGWGNIDDQVTCLGALDTANGGFLSLNNGLIVSGNGSVDLGSGALQIEDSTSRITGGSVSTSSQYIGKNGFATLTQSGGTNTPGRCFVGYNSTASGIYNLQDGQPASYPYYFYVGYYGTGVVNQSTGTCSAPLGYSSKDDSNKGIFLGYEAGSKGTYNLSGSGQLSFYNEYVAYSGTGTLEQTGGINSVLTDYVYDGLFLGYSSQSDGTYKLSGSGQLTAYNEFIGQRGNGAFFQSGGSNTLLGSDNRCGLFLGYKSLSYGNYELSGGQLTAAFENVGYVGTGVFIQSAGTNTITTALTLAAKSGSRGTYRLDGGVLVLKLLAGGSGTAIFDFGGGTLTASGTLSTSLPMTLTGMGGNANVDTNGYAVTLSGMLSGEGGLNKLGTGTLTMNATNTYQGDTNINAGTLALAATASIDASATIDVGNGAFLNASAKTSGLTLKNTQTLKGLGTIIGNIVAEEGSHIAPGESIGTLTVNGDVALNDGARLDYELGDVALSDTVAMSTNTLNLNNQEFTDFNFTTMSGFGEGIYTLIDAGTITGSLGAICSGTIFGNYTGELSISGNDLVLTVVPEPGMLMLLAASLLSVLAFAWRRR